VSKAFRVPHVRRHTIREQVFGLFGSRGYDMHRVLDAISFEVHAGETVGIMGRNGCGKSTLLRILAGIYAPDAGAVRVRGGVTALLELGVGWNPELDAVDNIYLMGTLMGLSLGELRQSVDEILDFAELHPFARMHLKHYSSGMAARLAYAVAFRAVRDVLVLDGSGSIDVRNVGGDFTVARDGSGSIRHSGVEGSVDVPERRRRGGR